MTEQELIRPHFNQLSTFSGLYGRRKATDSLNLGLTVSVSSRAFQEAQDCEDR